MGGVIRASGETFFSKLLNGASGYVSLRVFSGFYLVVCLLIFPDDVLIFCC